MAENTGIAGILFDAGDTLVRPASGQWFPGPRFGEILENYEIRGLDWDRLPQALEETRIFFDTKSLVATEVEELELFSDWYGIFLKCLGLVRPDERLLRELATAWVYEVEIEPFPDAIPALASLRSRGFSMGVLSNFWPSLERKFRLLGLRDYFDAFIISMQVGYQKPDVRIFQIAIERMGIEPARLLFVDDWAENVIAAHEFGLNAAQIVRDGHSTPVASRAVAADVPRIASLSQVDKLL